MLFSVAFSQRLNENIVCFVLFEKQHSLMNKQNAHTKNREKEEDDITTKSTNTK
jgi:hypothetical protein